MQVTLTMAQVRTIKNADAGDVAERASAVLVTPQARSGDVPSEEPRAVVVAYLDESGTNLATVTVFADGTVARGWMAS